jgi:hypothetical protein
MPEDDFHTLLFQGSEDSGGSIHNFLPFFKKLPPGDSGGFRMRL